MHRLKLKSLHRFTSTATAVEEISAIQEGKLGKGLKQFLSEQIVDKGKGKEQLLVSDTKLGEVFSSSRSYLLSVLCADSNCQRVLSRKNLGSKCMLIRKLLNCTVVFVANLRLYLMDLTHEILRP